MAIAVCRIENGQDIMVRNGLATKLEQHRREESTEVLLFSDPKVMEKLSERRKSTFPHIFYILNDSGTCQRYEFSRRKYQGPTYQSTLVPHPAMRRERHQHL